MRAVSAGGAPPLPPSSSIPTMANPARRCASGGVLTFAEDPYSQGAWVSDPPSEGTRVPEPTFMAVMAHHPSPGARRRHRDAHGGAPLRCVDASTNADPPRHLAA